MQKVMTFLDRYFLNRTLFKVLFVVMMMITSVPYLHMLVGEYVKFLLVYGYVILAYEVFTKRYFKLFEEKSCFLLVGFCVSYAITILLNRELNFSANVKALAYMFLFFSLFFMTDSDRSIQDLNGEIRLISVIVIICTFILSCVSFVTYAFSISGHYMTANGFIYFGMYDNRLWGVYNANTGSTLNSISILLSVGFLLNHKQKYTLFLNMLNLLLEFCCLVLTGSRAALYALAVILAILAFILCVRRKLQAYGKTKLRTFLLGWVSAAAVALVFLGSVNFAKEGLSYIPSLTSNFIEVIETQQDSDEESEIELKQYELTRIEELEDRAGGIFTGRLDIWKACFSAFKESPIFGVTRENIPEHAIPHLADKLWESNIRIGGPHNIYLCVLVSSGAIGFCLMAVFILNMFVRLLTSVIRQIKTCSIWMVISILLTLLFLIIEFVESRILYQVGIFYVLFWIYSGYAFAFSRRYARKEREVTQFE